MATAIQRRRGNTAQHASFTGLAGEITIDTDKNTVVVHDGSTAGGFPLALASEVAALGGADITAVIAGDGLTGGASSGNATINVVGGTGITVNADNVTVDMSVFSTSDLAEGTNLYFTAARARGNISVGGDLSYDSANGIISFTERTDAEVRGLVSVTDAGGDGSLSYDNSTGVITYTGPSQAEANSRIENYLSVTDAGGDGSLSYSGGVFTYTGPSQAEANTRIDARLSGTNGITYSSGAISVNAGYFDVAAGGTGFAANFEPSANNTYSLGSANNVWKDVYVGPGSLYVNGQQVLSDNSGTITLSADANQNISIAPSGSGDLELSAGGDIQLKSNITISTGQAITQSGGVKFASNLNVNSQYINNLTNPVQAQDAATKSYVDGATYLSAGDGLSKSTGTFSVDSSVVRTTGTQSISGDKTFGENVVISGNLTVSGTTTTVNSETINLADNIIELNSNASGAPTENAGITINRGSSADVTLRWNETDDRWQFTNDGSNYNNILLEADVEGFFSVVDSGGDGSLTYSNGVITYTGPSAGEVRAHFSAGTGVTITNGQVAIGQAVGAGDNVTFATVTADLTGDVTGTVSDISNHSTSDLTEGTNLYYTDTRARSAVSATDAGGDGSFAYNSTTGVFTYTGPSAAEVRAHVSAGGDLSYNSSTGVFSFTERTDAEVRGLFSASGDISYNSTTGVFSFTNDAGDIESVTAGNGLTGGGTSGAVTLNAVGGYGITVNADNIEVANADIKGLFSASDAGGDGSFAYNSTTGAFTYTGPSAAEVRAHFSAGTGVSITNGQVAIGQAVGTGADVTFNSVTASLVGNSSTATKLATARTIALSGDVTGSASFDGSANATISATIAANSVALGTDTTGNYVASVTNGNYITGGNGGSEGASLTIAVDATTTATASKVAARDSSGDLYANIFQGTATSARYADLAERYEADAILEPGTVVCFGGEKEITACDHENDHAVAGVVSTDPAYMMNSAAGNNDTHPYIALTGRVPVKVVGPVAKGDLLVASGVSGHAMANNDAKAGTIIGKAISSSDAGEGVVEALINLM